MKRAFVILLGALCVSCCPCRRLATSSKDSARVEVRTRTEYVRDTVYHEIPARSERITVRDTASHLENGYAASDARINADGSLFHSLRTIPRRVPLPFDRTVERRDSIVYQDRAVVQNLEVNRLTWWQQTQIRGCWILLAALLFVCRKRIIAWFRRVG